MQIHGKSALDATPRAVWDALTNPAILTRCLPGCDEFIQTSPVTFQASARVKAGPWRARLSVEIILTDIDPPGDAVPSSWTLEATALSPLGAATATTAIWLAERNGATELSYTAKATLGGKLALLAGRWSDRMVKLAMADFFVRLSQVLREEAALSGLAAHPQETGLLPIASQEILTEAGEAASPPNKKSRKRLWIGLGTAAVLAAAGVAAVLRHRTSDDVS